MAPFDSLSYIASAVHDPHLTTDTIPSAKPKSSKPPRSRQTISPDQASIHSPTPLRAAVVEARAAILADPATPAWSLARTLPVVGLIDLCQGQPTDPVTIAAFIRKESHECSGSHSDLRFHMAALVLYQRVEISDLSQVVKSALLHEIFPDHGGVTTAYNCVLKAVLPGLLGSKKLTKLWSGLPSGGGIEAARARSSAEKATVLTLVFRAVQKFAMFHSFKAHPSFTALDIVSFIALNFSRPNGELGGSIAAASDGGSGKTQAARTAVFNAARALCLLTKKLEVAESRSAHSGIQASQNAVVRRIDNDIALQRQRLAGCSAFAIPAQIDQPIGVDGDDDMTLGDTLFIEGHESPEDMLLRKSEMIETLDVIGARLRESPMTESAKAKAKTAIDTYLDEAFNRGWMDVLSQGQAIISSLYPTPAPAKRRGRPARFVAQVTPAAQPALVPSPTEIIADIEPLVIPAPATTPGQAHQLSLPLDLAPTPAQPKPKRLRRPARITIDQPYLPLLSPESLYTAHHECSLTDLDPHLPDPDPSPGLAGVVWPGQRPDGARLQQVLDQPAFRPDSLSRSGLLDFSLRPLPDRHAMAERRPRPRCAPPLFDLRPPMGIRPGLSPPYVRADRPGRPTSGIGPPGAGLACIGLPRSAHPHTQPLGP